MDNPPTQKPNAPGPEVLRDELINLMKGRLLGKVQSDKIEDLVDTFLAKIMEYYERMATPEAIDDGAVMKTLLDAMLTATQHMIEAGAALCEGYPEGSPQRSRWQVAATEMRFAGKAFLELVGN
jgi:hypothetical protein